MSYQQNNMRGVEALNCRWKLCAPLFWHSRSKFLGIHWRWGLADASTALLGADFRPSSGA